MRGGTKHGFRITVFGQRKRLSRQPFQISMLTHMHNGIDTCDLAQKRVEGNISVWRHQIGRVVCLFRIAIVTARGLNTDKGFTQPHQRQCKSDKFLRKVRIVFWRTPADFNFLLNRSGKSFEESLVLIQ